MLWHSDDTNFARKINSNHVIITSLDNYLVWSLHLLELLPRATIPEEQIRELCRPTPHDSSLHIHIEVFEAWDNETQWNELEEATRTHRSDQNT